jgi:pterin-4a-carbinolamine dehydratase
MKRALTASAKQLFLPSRTCRVPGVPVRLSSSSAVLVTHRTFASDSNSSKSSSSKPRPDPFARRPNQICDPYGQGGKPLTAAEAERLLATVHPDWSLQGENYEPTPATTNEDGNDDVAGADIPTQLIRSLSHPDFLSGSAFLNQVAAVAQMNDHFPSLHLERRLDSRRKQWRVVSTITCQTFVLQGLSHHDFFVATVRSLFVRSFVRSFVRLWNYVSSRRLCSYTTKTPPIACQLAVRNSIPSL